MDGIHCNLPLFLDCPVDVLRPTGKTSIFHGTWLSGGTHKKLGDERGGRMDIRMDRWVD